MSEMLMFVSKKMSDNDVMTQSLIVLMHYVIPDNKSTFNPTLEIFQLVSITNSVKKAKNFEGLKVFWAVSQIFT